MTPVAIAHRLSAVPEYLFTSLAEKRRVLESAGKKIIDLSIGDPDLPTPQIIINRLKEAVDNPEHHRYPQGKGSEEFRSATARFYRRRFGVELDPETEVMAVVGTKEGLAHLPLALINPGEYALVPDPAYPVYRTAVCLAGGVVVALPLLAENDFLPDLKALSDTILKRTKLLFLNYPNNPTGAIATQAFYQEVCELARRYNFIICQDNAYADIYCGDEPPMSILAIEGAKEVAVEFYSLSKTFNMTGWRVGAIVGNPEVLSALAKLKSNIDSGLFSAIQSAAATALDSYELLHPQILNAYKERREIFLPALKEIGWHVNSASATFYCWAKYPDSRSSFDVCNELLDKCGIIASPGAGFGDFGEGYVRFSLTAPTHTIKQSAEILISTFTKQKTLYHSSP
ncbi:LL-diaminopimelate aminotransferase [Candidatus Sumerlaeota bacterium]|nr:LL-diaminopimelate aminotransferase [Candidatus Sumerlaeota bacterium]